MADSQEEDAEMFTGMKAKRYVRSKKKKLALFQEALYQVNLITLFLIRNVKLEKKFRIASKMLHSKVFNDIVVQYITEEKQTEESLSFQIKYAQDEAQTICRSDLLTRFDGDFSLVEYYFSYIHLISNPERVFGNVKWVILFTDLDINDDVKDLVDSVDLNKDEIFLFKYKSKKSIHYKFKVAKVLSELKLKLDTFKWGGLASELIGCIVEGRFICTQKDSVTMKSLPFLIEHVIKVLGESRIIFQKNFVENLELCEDARVFREFLENEIISKSSAFKKEVQKKTTLADGTIFEELINSFSNLLEVSESVFHLKDVAKYLNIVEHHAPDLQFDASTSEEDSRPITEELVQDFLEHLIISANQPDEGELKSLIQEDMELYLRLPRISNEFAANYVQKNVLTWYTPKAGEDRHVGTYLTHNEGSAIMSEIKSKLKEFAAF